MLTAALHLTLAVQLSTAAAQPPPGICVSGELPELRVHTIRARNTPASWLFQTLTGNHYPDSPPLGARPQGWAGDPLVLKKRDARPPVSVDLLRLPVAAPRPVPVVSRWGILRLPGARPGTGYSSGPFTSIPPPPAAA